MSRSESLVAVVDDDASVCRSLSRLLSVHGYRVRTFASAKEYLDERESMDPSCLLADIRMPDIDGLAMHRAAAAHGMAVPTVFMTATGDIPTIVQAMKLGASDLLSKPFPAMVLLTAVEAAIARHDQQQKQEHTLAELWRAVSRLTPREAEVCGLVASGLLNKQVAAMIRTTEKTVKVHRARMTQKLQAHSLAELVRIVDRVMIERDRAVLSIDGVEVGRPRGVDIIARVLTVNPSAERNSA